ncbi:MAG TPA: glycoside hydrolase family 31 protein [Bacteroidales bacterium]
MKALLVLISLFPAMVYGQAYKSHAIQKDRLSVQLTEGVLDIIPLADGAVRVQYKKELLKELPELIFTNASSAVKFKVSDAESALIFSTDKMIVKLHKANGSLAFSDKSGKVFLSEKENSRWLVPDSVHGEPCYKAEQSFVSPSGEALFGLGQFQDGHYNLRGVTRRLIQVNSQIALPFIYSGKGYGLLWHQYGLTDFNPADNFISLEKQEASASANNQVAEVTTTSGMQKVSQDQTAYKGKFTVPVDGEYSIFLDLGDMGNRQFVVIDGIPCIDQSNLWLPPSISALVKLKAGEHHVQLVCKSSNNPELSWKRNDNLTTFRSPNATMLDYVVFYGPSADSVISAYRNLSGNVPMFPQWAYGFWQCRERYTSGSHLVATVKEFRKRNLPMDVIVQDWQYWGNKGWGVPVFDDVNYANPAGFIKEIHDQHAHFNISIWSNPDRNSTLGKDYVAKNLYVQNSKWLDYFNPVTRETYWKSLNDNLFTHGVDSWWMDATEPENDALKGAKTFYGLGDFYRLTYPMFVSQAVYEGQRKLTSEKRVCILTRSAFLGQQRYGVINWSGDIGSDWDTYRRQIVAGLNYTITGFPYWTTDIGGFFRPGNGQYTDEKYHEVLTRWFQWGALNPIFRIHGFMSETEPWKFGSQVENNMRKMLDLRYRLLPYIYSEAWQVSHNGSTLMRPLVMDFNGDTVAVGQPYEFMFGKAFLVAPVTEPNLKEQAVYLPKTATWYDFWTGKRLNGGQTVKTEIPLDKVPLFVKAGAIVPMGKFIQYAGQKSADTLEIRVYAGADGTFGLYEDEGDNYNYEKGGYSTISFEWNEKKQTLTIGQRYGDFSGCLKNRVFNVVLVNENNGTGILSGVASKQVLYSGKKINLKL